MYLTVIIGQGTLRSMEKESRSSTQKEDQNAPRQLGSRKGLMPESHDNSYINSGKPHIT